MNVKNRFKKLLTVILAGLFLPLGFSSLASAATSYSLFGDASEVPGGNPGNAAQLVSTATNGGFGGVLVTPSAPINWANLTHLSLDYNVTDDDCGGGSPRAQVRIDTNNDGVSDGSVRIALGPSPSFTDCAAGWQSSGNLIGNMDAGRYDYSVFGGSPFTTYNNAPAAVTSGRVVGVTVVVDGFWSVAATNGDSEQTVLVDNIKLNSDTTTFPVTLTKRSECKNGGWKNSEAPKFKNQGQCIGYVMKHDVKIDGNNARYNAGGLNRKVEFSASHANDDGHFRYEDANGDKYKVKISVVNNQGNFGWFAGKVTSASNPAWVGLWLFAKVEDSGTDKIWGDFTDQATAENGVNNKLTPAGGPFSVTSGNIKIK